MLTRSSLPRSSSPPPSRPAAFDRLPGRDPDPLYVLLDFLVGDSVDTLARKNGLDLREVEAVLRRALAAYGFSGAEPRRTAGESWAGARLERSEPDPKPQQGGEADVAVGELTRVGVARAVIQVAQAVEQLPVLALCGARCARWGRPARRSPRRRR